MTVGSDAFTLVVLAKTRKRYLVGAKTRFGFHVVAFTPLKNTHRKLWRRTLQIIGTGNHKGGTGKTTTAIHLAAALGERGRKVLLIDLDGNLGLTKSFDVPTVVQGTYHVLMGDQDIEDLILTPETEQERAKHPGEPIDLPKNVHLIPGNRRLENFDEDHAGSKGKYIAGFDTLTGPLKRLEESGLYDYVILDTAPAAGTLTIAAYKNADWFILATTAESLAVEALERSLDDIIEAQDVNSKLEVLGVHMCQVDLRKKLEQAYVEQVRQSLLDEDGEDGGFGLFDAIVPIRAVIGRASALKVSLFDYDPEPAEVKMVNELRGIYRTLAEEVEERIAASDAAADVVVPAERRPLTEPEKAGPVAEKQEGVAHG